MTYPFRLEILAQHDRAEFDCGVPPLNDYFQVRVGQDIRRRFTACYVALDTQTSKVAGYYTIASGSVPRSALPEKTAKRLPRYPSVPVVRIGRLAVDLRYRGQKLGSVLLADALKRTIESEIAAYAAVVDAKDDQAVAFYEHHGFISLTGNPRTLFLPLDDAVKQLARGQT